jgi:hypothetical protein
MEINRRCADLGLGLVDGSVVALAEVLGIRRLATVTCVISQLSDSRTVARSTWSLFPRIPTDLERGENLTSVAMTDHTRGDGTRHAGSSPRSRPGN